MVVHLPNRAPQTGITLVRAFSPPERYGTAGRAGGLTEGIAIGLTVGSGSGSGLPAGGVTAGGVTAGGLTNGVAAGVWRIGVGDADAWAAGVGALPG